MHAFVRRLTRFSVAMASPAAKKANTMMMSRCSLPVSAYQSRLSWARGGGEGCV